MCPNLLDQPTKQDLDKCLTKVHKENIYHPTFIFSFIFSKLTIKSVRKLYEIGFMYIWKCWN